jgi:hypothetical protein
VIPTILREVALIAIESERDVHLTIETRSARPRGYSLIGYVVLLLIYRVEQPLNVPRQERQHISAGTLHVSSISTEREQALCIYIEEMILPSIVDDDLNAVLAPVRGY